MLPTGYADVHDDITDPRGHPPAPQGVRCRACGRIEPDPGARFCGVCGAPIEHPHGAGPAADTIQLAHPEQARPGGPAHPGGQVYAAGASAGYPEPAPPARAVAYAPAHGTASGDGERIVYRVPSVGLWGSARIGAALSAAFTLLPCLVFAFAGAWAVHAFKLLLDSWIRATVPVPVPLVSVNLTMNFIELLHLQALHDRLISWDSHLWLVFAVVWLVPWAVWIIAGALFGVLLAVIYNLVGRMGGGLRVTLTQDATAVPATWSAPMSPGPPPTWAPGRQR